MPSLSSGKLHAGLPEQRKGHQASMNLCSSYTPSASPPLANPAAFIEKNTSQGFWACWGRKHMNHSGLEWQLQTCILGTREEVRLLPDRCIGLSQGKCLISRIKIAVKLPYSFFLVESFKPISHPTRICVLFSGV